MIKYHEQVGWSHPTFRTQKYGNIMCDHIQGTVDQSDDGEWHGWFDNYSNPAKSCFRLGFKTRSAAARWVNGKLREAGVK